MPEPLTLLFVALVGLVAGWLLGRGRLKGLLATATTEAAVLQERLGGLQRERVDLVSRAAKIDLELRTLGEQRARLETALSEQARTSHDKVAFLEQASQQLRDSFQALSAEALQRLNEGARIDLTQRQQAIETMVTPLTSSLTQVDQHLHALEKLGTTSQATLSQQITSLGQTQTELRLETQRLASALQSTSSRGRWGEMHLRRVVELAGLVEHCDFDTQVTLVGEGVLRPDLVVRLPGGRTLAVDAKVPLTAFLEVAAATNADERQMRLTAHAKALKDHVRALGSKSYWKQLERSPEFVVLFLPGEGFFSAALEADSELVDFAASAGVVIATPTTLIALLRAIAFGWNEEQVAANAREIMKLGRDLYDRLRIFTGHFAALRSAISGSVDAYNKALGSLETRVLVTTRKLQELGAGTGEPLAELIRIDTEPRVLPASEPIPGPETARTG